MKFLPLAALMLLTSSAFAADQYNFKLLGFSKDNKKVAFVESVSQDGSGHGVAYVSIIDVKANNLLKRVDHRDEGINDEGGSEEVAVKQAIAKADLKSFGIDTANKGQTLLDRLPTDKSSYKDSVFSQNVYLSSYSLVLAESPAKSDSCYDMGTPKMFKLTLKGQNVNVVLNDDKVLPKSRGCVLKYGVSKVIKSGDALVVIVTKSTPGFEGPDSSHMAVTGEVKLD